MVQIPDDPVIRCIERTGYPPWYGREDDDELFDFDEMEDCDDVFYGNESADF